MSEPFAAYQRTSALFTEACRVPGSSVAGSPEYKRVAKRRISPGLVACQISDVKAAKQIDAVRGRNSITLSSEHFPFCVRRGRETARSLRPEGKRLSFRAQCVLPNG